MRPIKLSMQAFGPYANKVEVDFTKFGNNGLYLITGDTGAGKTTIFDGISYALFDKTSGNERSPEMLRSKYANENTVTEVELVFSYNNKEYKVKRCPKYPFINRNNKLDYKGPSVELTYPNGKVLTQIKETNQAIRDLLGLDFDQFKRIVMIAQGDFKELILDKENKRIDIFRKIFDTKLYEDIQNSLWENRKSLSEEYKDYQKSIKQYVDSAYYGENDDLDIELDEIKNKDDILTKDILSCLNKINDKDDKNIKELENKNKAFQTKLEKINNELGLIEKYAEYREKLDELKDNKKDLEPSFNKIKKEYELNKTKQKDIDKETKKLIVLKEELEKFEDVEDKKDEISELKENLKDAQTNEKKTAKNLDDEKKKLDSYKKEKKSLEKIGESKQKLENGLEKCEKLEESLDELQEDYNEFLSLNKKQEKAKNEYLKIRDEVKKIKLNYDENYQLFLDGQAGILAEKLVDNKPCPVCGSLEHPKKAKKPNKIMSQSELDDLRVLVDNQTKLEADKSKILNSINGQIENLKKTLLGSAKKLLKIDNLDDFVNAMNIVLKDNRKESDKLQKQIDEIEDKITRYEELDELIDDANETIEDLANEKNELSKNIVASKTKVDSLNKQIERIIATLTSKTFDDAEKKYNKLNESISSFKLSFEKCEKEYSSLNKELIEINTEISSLEEQLKEAKKGDVEKLKTSKEELTDSIDEAVDLLRKLSARYKNNTDICKNIESIQKRIKKVEDELQYVNILCDTANGRLKGKQKVDFETYIQMNYFDRILAYGNQRLLIMSDGQYEFIRGEEGLDLDIIDHYNGTRREVSTLSGGESFMASLSLALGMSDEVQRRASSVHIDTMFVDEGFGSLDDEALNRAINALSMLSDSNKLVGLISHIPELQNKIENQIIVKKDKINGSRIEQ